MKTEECEQGKGVIENKASVEKPKLQPGDWCIWTKRERTIGFIRNGKDFKPARESLPYTFETEPHPGSPGQFQAAVDEIALMNGFAAKHEHDDEYTTIFVFLDL